VEGPPLISVRTRVVLDTLVGSIADTVAARAEEPLGAAVEAALARAGDGPAQWMARAGYLARAVEVERFERARASMPWLAERAALDPDASWSAAAAALAATLAAAEPIDRPDPGDDGAVSWKVPGPGGHVRHYVALVAAERSVQPAGHLHGKLPWLIGFLVHCIEEVSPPADR
jgi:hypothetical protein